MRPLLLAPYVLLLAAPAAALAPYAYKPLPVGSVTPKGWLLKQLTLQAEGLSGHLAQFWNDVMNSVWIGGSGDGGLLHGAAGTAAREAGAQRANEGGAQEATAGANEGGNSTRWLLRHLEVTPGDPGAPATGPTEVLYSVPARLPLGT